MNQKKKQNPFWHLAGPLLGYWVIQLVAEIIAGHASLCSKVSESGYEPCFRNELYRCGK